VSRVEKPTRKEGGLHFEYQEEHPAYGMIGVSRVSGRARLYGSDFEHQHFLQIRITRGYHQRGLNNDWHHGTEQLIEVSLSEAQWATFVSSPNIGSGVPCTIEWINKGKAHDELAEASDVFGRLPDIAPTESRREQYKVEVDERLQKAFDELDQAIGNIKGITMSEKNRQMVLGHLDRVRGNITAGLPWVAEQFAEHAEETIEKAKIEINAYVTQALMSAGAQALNAGQEAPIKLIESGEEDQ
jgi:hypothetical protein